MFLHISDKSDIPIYEQLYEQISGQILRGELAADFCLPSIRTVAKELGISVITVKNAYELLERDKFIYTRAGKGCFVAEHAPENLEQKRIKIAEEKLKTDIAYYKNLQISSEELIELIKKLY